MGSTRWSSYKSQADIWSQHGLDWRTGCSVVAIQPPAWRLETDFCAREPAQCLQQWFSQEWKIVGQGEGSSRLGDLYLGTWSHDLPLEAHPPSILRFLGTKRQLSRLTLPTSIQRVHTRNVDLGGALKGATANFLLVGFPQKCHITSTPLRRSLRFALDFGVMESESVCDDSRCLTPDSIPTFAELSLPVVLPGSYGKTIKRPLLPHEVGALLHFPGWLSREQLRHLLAVTPPPLLGFTFIIDAVLPSLPHHRAIRSFPLPPLPSRPSSRHTWLPDYALSNVGVLQRSLPHDWVDPALVVHKAAKSDGANVPTHLWSSRITLLLGGSQASLDTLRSFALRLNRRRLVRSFCRYMRRTHGAAWVSELLTGRRSRKRTRGGFSFDHSEL